MAAKFHNDFATILAFRIKDKTLEQNKSVVGSLSELYSIAYGNSNIDREVLRRVIIDTAEELFEIIEPAFKSKKLLERLQAVAQLKEARAMIVDSFNYLPKDILSTNRSKIINNIETMYGQIILMVWGLRKQTFTRH